MTKEKLQKAIEIKKEIDWCNRILKSDNREHPRKILGQGSYIAYSHEYDTEFIPPWLWEVIINEIKTKKEEVEKELAEL